ncbi:MAG: ATP-binding protein [Bacteroidia bacterium]|nr:ATP-binding protein [Bacteroidia bacterium]
MIDRFQLPQVQAALRQGKAIILTGPRQVGKTTLMQIVAGKLDTAVFWMTGDDPAVRTLLENISLARLKAVVGDHQIVVIDEAQRLTNAGLTLKLMTDHLPGVQLLVTGSSSLDLAAQTKESLVGRKWDYTLLPLSFAEMCAHHGLLQEMSLLEQRLIYGYYPEVVMQGTPHAARILHDLSDGLMYKDLLSLEQVRKPALLVKILQALALQISREVRYHEIAQLVGADPVTVERYIDLLEQTFVVFRLRSLSRNVRNELKKGCKVYFYDTGIRNALIKNFNPLSLRADTGALWENFLVVERLKRNLYQGYTPNMFFWRTTAQQEIDYVEEYGGKLYAWEFKWKPGTRTTFPKVFLQAYPGSETMLIHPDNMEAFIL